MKNTSPSRANQAHRPSTSNRSTGKLGFLYCPTPIAALLDKRLSPGDALIVGQIAFASNGPIGACILSNRAIAGPIGLTERYVECRIPDLERLGYFKRTFKSNGRRASIALNLEMLKIVLDGSTPQNGEVSSPRSRNESPHRLVP